MYNFALPKVDNVSQQPAAEMNSVFNELENIVTTSGQALNNSDNLQLARASSIYAAGGDFYIDSGTANAFVLGVPDSKIVPSAYYNGMRVRFVPANTNTAAATVNVAAIGVKNIKRFNGTGTLSALSASDILMNNPTTLIYLSTPDCFVLVKDKPYWQTRYHMSATQTINTGGSATDIAFDTVDFDNTGFYNTSTKRFTPITPFPVSFLFVLSSGIVSAQTNVKYLCEIQKNGGAYATDVKSTSLAGDLTLKTFDIVPFNGSTDYAEFIFENFGTSTIQLDAATNRTYFTAYRVA